MKRSAVIVLACLALAACKKDYTCTCVTTDSSGAFPPETSEVMLHATKSKAKSVCDGSNQTFYTQTTACTLH